MRRFMLLAAMCAALVLVMAPAGLAQSRGPSGADGTYNCADFDFQEDAQAFFNNDPGDTNGLDGPPGDASTGQPGVACEELPSRGTTTGGGMTQQPTTPTQYTQPETPNTRVTPDGIQYSALPDATPSAEVPVASTTTTALPATGGPSLVLLASALLIGGGLILRGRRS